MRETGELDAGEVGTLLGSICLGSVDPRTRQLDGNVELYARCCTGNNGCQTE